MNPADELVEITQQHMGFLGEKADTDDDERYYMVSLVSKDGDEYAFALDEEQFVGLKHGVEMTCELEQDEMEL